MGDGATNAAAAGRAGVGPTPDLGDEPIHVGSGSTPFMFDDPGDNLGPKSNDLWKPVIAAVNGMACGGAFYMLGEVEFIIAADHATFFDPHVSYGMTACFESIHMLQKMPFGEIVRLHPARQRRAHVGPTGAPDRTGLGDLPAGERVGRAGPPGPPARIAKAPSLAAQGTPAPCGLGRALLPVRRPCRWAGPSLGWARTRRASPRGSGRSVRGSAPSRASASACPISSRWR